MTSYAPMNEGDRAEIEAFTALSNGAEAISGLRISLEMLYHFQCGHCDLGWLIADFKWRAGDLVHCPHCGGLGRVPEKSLLNA